MSQNPMMLQEIKQSPQVIARQLMENSEATMRLVNAVQERDPAFAMTIARGTSDHASSFIKYALETSIGLVTASASPSITGIYDAKLKLENALVIAVSQSGQSPDVVGSLQAARDAGAITVAVVNQPNSPLENIAEFVFPMHAGEEKSVAATKTFVSSLVALLPAISELSGDKDLALALKNLPNICAQSLENESIIKEKVDRYRYAEKMIVLGRGFHFPIALETALKLKETCVIQAEAFSSAEFAHGPMILIEQGFPVIAFQAKDKTKSGSLERYHDLANKGAEFVLIGGEAPSLEAEIFLSTPSTGHPLTDPIPAILSGYLFAAHLSLAKGMDPDKPRSLNKVTKTL